MIRRFLIFFLVFFLPLSSEAAEVIVKRYAQPAPASVISRSAVLFSEADQKSQRLLTLEEGVVLPLLGRTNRKVNAWGEITYWFETVSQDKKGWVLGTEIDFLRPYYGEDSLINFFLSTRSTPKPAQVSFYEIDLDGDGRLELILQWIDPTALQNKWRVAVCELERSGLASGGVLYRALFEKEGDGPFDIWFEDDDMDKRIDVLVSYSNSDTYSLSLVKWIYADDKIREAFEASVSRDDSRNQINLVNRPDGRVDVEKIARSPDGTYVKEYYSSQFDGSYRQISNDQ